MRSNMVQRHERLMCVGGQELERLSGERQHASEQMVAGSPWPSHACKLFQQQLPAGARLHCDAQADNKGFI